MIEAILSLQLLGGAWIPQEVTTFDACVYQANILAANAYRLKAEGAYLSIEYAGRDVEITGVRCEPIDCEEPTS